MTKPIKKIVAIGGGEIRTAGTLAIDKEIIRLAQKERPKLLFIPTASSDSEGYWKHIDKYYGKKLGCKTDVLFLLKETPSSNEIKEKILGADIIYVGGGNTLKMVKLWRRLGVDKLLKTAWQRGIVLCGISAGSICWFESGHSDSMSFYNQKKWKYINVHGLGFLKGIHCPHYNSQTLGVPRKNHFRKMIQKIGGMGITIDNNCAIEFLDDKYRVITSKKYAKAFRVFKKDAKVHSKRIPQLEELTPIATLFKR
ncbi:MAG: peptidase E [Candidatus Aenigmarchaeota archaeon]|nr:peptidase E [Candidatus Aenigmarchaeota archaeon]